MLGGGWVQDHSLSSHRDIRCEWEAYLWCVPPGNNLRYNKWHYLLEALVYAISSSFGEKDLTVSCVFQLFGLPELLDHCITLKIYSYLLGWDS